MNEWGVRLRHPQIGRSVHVQGRLGGRSVATVRRGLHRAVDVGSGDLVVDLSGAEVIDAAGVGVVVGTHLRACRRGRRLVIVSASPRLRAALVQIGLAHIVAPAPASAA